MFQTNVAEKIKTHILCSKTFSLKSCRLGDNVDKYCTAGQATDDNMAHAHCVLDKGKGKVRPCAGTEALDRPAGLSRGG